MSKVVISILHYGKVKDTRDCLDSLLKVSTPGFSIKALVVDNGTDEKFRLEIKVYEKINLEIIRSDKNLGFTGGHNFALSHAGKEGFDYFLLLNNDSLVDKMFLSALIDDIADAGAAVPKIYFSKGREFHKEKYKESDLGKVIWYAGGFMDWENVMSRHRGVDEVDCGQYDKVESIEFATGACLLLKQEVIEKVGLFDDRYFLYFEDADLSMRIRREGFKINYCPESVVWHNNAGSSGVGSGLHDYYLTRNRMLFGMAHAPFRSKVALFKESLRLLTIGRKWQKVGVRDFYLKKFGKGSYEN